MRILLHCYLENVCGFPIWILSSWYKILERTLVYPVLGNIPGKLSGCFIPIAFSGMTSSRGDLDGNAGRTLRQLVVKHAAGDEANNRKSTPDQHVKKISVKMNGPDASGPVVDERSRDDRYRPTLMAKQVLERSFAVKRSLPCQDWSQRIRSRVSESWTARGRARLDTKDAQCPM